MSNEDLLITCAPDFSSEMSYVQRRKSEIEARHSGAEVPVDYRKYSEGSLNLSRNIFGFSFGHEKRHVVFDSKNLPIGKSYSSGGAPRPVISNVNDASASLANLTLVYGEKCIDGEVTAGNTCTSDKQASQ